MAASDAPVRPIGSTVGDAWSNSGWGWPVDSLEHIPDMSWPTSIKTLSRMRTDPTLASVLAAYNTPLISADWRIDPRGASPEAVALCADSLGIPVSGEQHGDIGPVRRRGVKWSEHVRLALLHLVYGFCAFEPVYEIRDGKAYLLALPERMPSTVIGINTNDDGSLKSIEQTGVFGQKISKTGTIEIPADRLLYYVHQREGALWAGRSLLRPAYSMWLLKLDTLRVNAIGIARFGAGTPVAEPLPGTNPTPAQIATAQQMVSSMRVGEMGGAVPVGFKLRVVGVEGTLPDALPTLAYYDQQSARACLTSILDLGNTATGSRALGDNYADMLTRSLQSIAEQMAETATQLCERLVTFNWGEGAEVPAVTCGEIGSTPATIAQAITGLITAGAITPDPALEAWTREAFHLPPAKPVAAPPPIAPAPAPPVPSQPAPTQSDATLAASSATNHVGSERNLIQWFEHGAGAALIAYGTPGQFDRCVAIAGKHMPPDEARGFCSNRIKSVTGEWPGAHSHVHAAGPTAAPTADPQYRAPTPAEQASGIDPAQIDADHESLVSEGASLWAPIVAVWGAALATQIAAALSAGSLVALARLKLRLQTSDAAQALKLLMSAAADDGVKQAIAEGTAAGVAHGVDAASVVLDADSMDAYAEALAEQASTGMAAAAGRAAMGTAAPGADPKTAAQEAVDQVTSNSATNAVITQAVNYAMSGGRQAAEQAIIDATPDINWIVFSSAIRDSGTCSPCLVNDGHQYPSIAAAQPDFWQGRYSNCLGRDRCRCIVAIAPSTSPIPMFGDPAHGGGMDIANGGNS